MCHRKNEPHFVSSADFHADEEYFAWLREIKDRYQRIRSRVALQANSGALEFNWQLGRDIVHNLISATLLSSHDTTVFLRFS